MIVVGALAYGGAVLLNAGTLHQMASRLPFGHQRDVALSAADAAGDVSAHLSLDQPGRLVQRIRGDEPSSTPARAPVAAPPTTASPPTTAPAPTTTTASPTPDAILVEPAPPSADGATAPTTPTTVPPAPPVTTTAAAPATTTVPPLRMPTPAQPLQIWVGGDSIAEGLGASLERLAGQTPDLQASSEARISTGLTRPDYFDWPAAIDTVVEQSPPDVMVVVFGTNDPQPIQTAAGTFSFGTPEWDAEYRARIDSVMSTASGPHKLVWVGLPVVRRDSLEPKLEVLDQMYAQEAAKYPDVSYVDTHTMFSPDGTYDAYLTRPDGTPTLVRAADGIHFNNAGYDMLAQAVIARVHALTQPG